MHSDSNEKKAPLPSPSAGPIDPDSLTAIGFHSHNDRDQGGYDHPFFLSPPSSTYAGNIVRICFEPHLGCDGWSIAEVIEQDGRVQIIESVHIPEIESMDQLRQLALALGIVVHSPPGKRGGA